MNYILFIVAVILELFYLIMFTATIRIRSFRFWPPPSPRSWQFFVSWFVALLVAVSFLFLGLLDFDSFLLPKLQLRFYLALPFFIFGAAMGIWGSASFNLRSTLGLGDKLIITGPYKHTRNPQYIGDSSNIIGFMILTNSWMVWVIGILGVALNILAPFTEETWLEEIFGEEYTEYKRNVPRFFRFGGKDNSG